MKDLISDKISTTSDQQYREQMAALTRREDQPYKSAPCTALALEYFIDFQIKNSIKKTMGC